MSDGSVARPRHLIQLYLSIWPRKNRCDSCPFPDDFRTFDQRRIVDDQRAALAAAEVLGFVKA